MRSIPQFGETALQRLRLDVRGVVQGVGFRPFVHGLAKRLDVTGFVGNESGGVVIEIEGTPRQLEAFQESLTGSAPPLAFLESVTVAGIPARGAREFLIVESAVREEAHTLISPDVATCGDCLSDLADPSNRRYRYPFTNCTNCGPRFTIVRDIPYDRPLTTMAGFQMCPDCRREYDDPLDRRFHAQPNACPACGPRVEFRRLTQDARTGSLFHDEAMRAARAALGSGAILAVKGIGGFHLACDATSESAITRLRERKGRVDKPFALMARDMETVLRFAVASDEERVIVKSRARPIVLLRRRPDSALPSVIAPGNEYVGVMLPYSPLHHVLLSEEADALVLTSGNASDEPIARDNDEALDRLAHLADAFLLHDRPIHVHCDDSVIRVFEGGELPIRRSRGYAPFPVRLPFDAPSVLAVGGELKATFCLTRDDHAFLSQHIGDMENLETLSAFARAVAHFRAIFRVEPEIVAADLHPGYLSSRWARENLASLSSKQAVFTLVQHHHAHVASVMAENGVAPEERVIGFAFDGTGYGTDGAIWGGEVFIASYANVRRAAHLGYVPLPGGDAAIKRPYRAALAHLWAAGAGWNPALPPVAACPDVERGVVRRQLETGFNAVASSSMGRLFDAVASLAGVRQTVTYEAQAAIEFEALAEPGVEEAYAFGLTEGEPMGIDATPTVRAVVDDVLAGVPAGIVSARFHNAVANTIALVAKRIAAREGLERVALSGGVFQNVTLLAAAAARLRAAGFEVFTHSRVPPNDGGLALGQAAVAAARARSPA